MSTRTGKAAGDWGRAHSEVALDGRSWYRRCKEFVRLCFGVPSNGTPDAGTAWDRAKHKHVTSNPFEIPAWVPVFWEQPSVADHVALSIGGGRCLSNDFTRTGKIDEVAIDAITKGWGGTLLGWTEDIDGVRVYEPPAPEPPEKNRVQKARMDVHDAIARLDRAVGAGRGDDVKALRKALRQALRGGVKK